MSDSAFDPSAARGRPFARAPVHKEVAAVALGGALGANLRLALSRTAALLDLHPTFGTGLANFSGAFLLGVLLARFESPSAHPLFRPFWVIGVFGSFTTFSTLAMENRLLAGGHGELVALVHLAGSIAMGLLAFALGHRAARERR